MSIEDVNDGNCAYCDDIIASCLAGDMDAVTSAIVSGEQITINVVVAAASVGNIELVKKILDLTCENDMLCDISNGYVVDRNAVAVYKQLVADNEFTRREMYELGRLSCRSGSLESLQVIWEKQPSIFSCKDIYYEVSSTKRVDFLEYVIMRNNGAMGLYGHVIPIMVNNGSDQQLNWLVDHYLGGWGEQANWLPDVLEMLGGITTIRLLEKSRFAEYLEIAAIEWAVVNDSLEFLYNLAMRGKVEDSTLDSKYWLLTVDY